LLNEAQVKFKVKLEAFVLMNNHLYFHTPDANINFFMRFFNKKLGVKISRQVGRINRIFRASCYTEFYHVRFILYECNSLHLSESFKAKIMFHVRRLLV